MAEHRANTPACAGSIPASLYSPATGIKPSRTVVSLQAETMGFDSLLVLSLTSRLFFTLLGGKC
jgi:hypothetical protein